MAECGSIGLWNWYGMVYVSSSVTAAEPSAASTSPRAVSAGMPFCNSPSPMPKNAEWSGFSRVS